MNPIYKVCGRSEWETAVVSGQYAGSDHDRQDGFIHLSTGAQLGNTLAKHFPERDDLLLVAIDSEMLGGALKWEPARDGDLFPHLYGELPVGAALWTQELELGASGRHILPEKARP